MTRFCLKTHIDTQSTSPPPPPPSQPPWLDYRACQTRQYSSDDASSFFYLTYLSTLSSLRRFVAYKDLSPYSRKRYLLPFLISTTCSSTVFCWYIWVFVSFTREPQLVKFVWTHACVRFCSWELHDLSLREVSIVEVRKLSNSQYAVTSCVSQSTVKSSNAMKGFRNQHFSRQRNVLLGF